MIVEDEAILRRIVKDAVEEAGHCVTAAEDGEEALRLFRAERPHLVIADIMLPKLDGFEMVRRMHERGANTQFIFLSALDRTNIDKFRRDLYGMVREIHCGRYPFNNFLY